MEARQQQICSTDFHINEIACKLKAMNVIKNVPYAWIAKDSDEESTTSRDWLHGFMKLHSDLSLSRPSQTLLGRAAAFNKPVVSAFFDTYERVHDSHQSCRCMKYGWDGTVHCPQNEIHCVTYRYQMCRRNKYWWTRNECDNGYSNFSCRRSSHSSFIHGQNSRISFYCAWHCWCKRSSKWLGIADERHIFWMAAAEFCDDANTEEVIRKYETKGSRWNGR